MYLKIRLEETVVLVLRESKGLGNGSSVRCRKN